jgi:hypothetical protein
MIEYEVRLGLFRTIVKPTINEMAEVSITQGGVYWNTLVLSEEQWTAVRRHIDAFFEAQHERNQLRKESDAAKGREPFGQAFDVDPGTEAGAPGHDIS